MAVIKGIVIGAAVIVVILAIAFLIAFFRMMYYSIPYDEWVKLENEKERKKKRGKRCDR